VRIGYRNIVRLPHGYFGWKAYRTGGKTNLEDVPAVKQGDIFPSCQLALLDRKRDREYLGLRHEENTFALEDLTNRYVLIELFDERCYACIEQLDTLKAFFNLLENDGSSEKDMKLIGIGVGSKKRTAAKFRKERNIPFPIFADEKRDIFECLGRPMLPASYLVDLRSEPSRKILSIYQDHIESPEAFRTRLSEQIETLSEK
jgi:peroxiredoxin